MFTGNLKLLVLKLVNSKEMSGYELMKSIKEKTGSKPSPGSMYPLLEELKNKSQISVKEEGRAKKYSITEQGKRSVDDFMKQKNLLLGNIKSSIDVFCTMTGNSESECIEMLNQLCKEKKTRVR